MKLQRQRHWRNGINTHNALVLPKKKCHPHMVLFVCTLHSQHNILESETDYWNNGDPFCVRGVGLVAEICRPVWEKIKVNNFHTCSSLSTGAYVYWRRSDVSKRKHCAQFSPCRRCCFCIKYLNTTYPIVNTWRMPFALFPIASWHSWLPHRSAMMGLGGDKTPKW